MCLLSLKNTKTFEVQNCFVGHKIYLYKLLKTKQKVRYFIRFEEKYENRIKN